MDEDSEEDEGTEDEEDEDEEMPEDEEEPDDFMTLVQYQAGVRRETLIRKSVYEDDPSQKKGRLEPGGSGP